MNKDKSIIKSLPIQNFNSVLDRLGLEKTWYSVLYTYLENIERKDLKYILNEPEFKGVDPLDFNFIKGLSVGEISVLYEYSLAYMDRDSRKQEGQYFTPDDVAQVMAKRACGFLENKIWVDPCSGVGNLSFWLIDGQKDSENFLKNNIYLIDRDKLALFVARFILVVNFQKNDSSLFSKIKSHFIVVDFLAANKLPKFDYAILNPPYVNVPIDPRFETGSARDLYAYFLERIIKNTEGFVSITPQTFTNGQKFDSLRKLLLDNFTNVDIYCFDNVPDNIFRGIKFGSKNTNTANSTRAGIIVARKGQGRTGFRITPLLRWRVKERQVLLDSVDNFLSKVTPREDLFPKIQNDLVLLYNFVIKQDRTLSDFLTNKETPYKLTVPSTPRYFISALKCDVNRTSFKLLFFNSKEDMNIAYLLLNSSYMYWWWRVNDGGMTISEKTLLSLPVVFGVKVDENLVKKIEASERTNRVIKRNAGKDNENVKHDSSLVGEITGHLFPEFASALKLVHNNSVI